MLCLQQTAAQGHAHQRQQQPGQLAQRQSLLPKGRCQQQQDKRLHVIDHRSHRDGAVAIGREQAHPVEHQRQPAHQQPQPLNATGLLPLTGVRHPGRQPQRTQQTAQPDHQHDGQPTLHHQQANGA